MNLSRWVVYPLQSAPDEQFSEPFTFRCTNYAQSLGVKCSLTHSFSVEFGAIVSGTWNQPAYKNQTKLQKHVVFSQIKNTTPQLGDSGATETAFALPLSSALLESLLGSRPANRRELDGAVLPVLNWWKPWATCFSFFFFPLFYLWSYPTPTPTPGNGLRPVLELAMVYSVGHLKKLGEIRLGSLELPLMCLLFIWERWGLMHRWAHL